MSLDENLLEFLKIHGKQPRDTIVKQLGIARSTIYDALQRLESQKLVKREPYHNQQIGRPRVFFEAIN